VQNKNDSSSGEKISSMRDLDNHLLGSPKKKKIKEKKKEDHGYFITEWKCINGEKD